MQAVHAVNYKDPPVAGYWRRVVWWSAAGLLGARSPWWLRWLLLPIVQRSRHSANLLQSLLTVCFWANSSRPPDAWAYKGRDMRLTWLAIKRLRKFNISLREFTEKNLPGHDVMLLSLVSWRHQSCRRDVICQAPSSFLMQLPDTVGA